jgi:hypothetical protein
MSDVSAKLLQYIQSGYHIKKCVRSKNKRIIKLEASIFSIFQPTLTMTDQEYETTMRVLISWLIRTHNETHIVEVCTSHYGHEWAELRTRQGKLRSKMALSVRAIHSLKVGLLAKADRTLLQQVGSDGAPHETAPPDRQVPAEFPRQLPRRPAIARDQIPEQWR